MNPLFKIVIIIIAFVLITGCGSSHSIQKNIRECSDASLNYSTVKSGDALVVWVQGEIVLEDYHQHYNPEQPHPITEISTLLSALAVLSAVDEGMISLDQPASDIITEWKNDPDKKDITLSQLLYATSGLETGSHKRSASYQNVTLAEPVFKPDHRFQYGPTPYQILGEMLRQVAGAQYLKNKILAPLDIPGERWLAVSGSEYNPLTGRTELIPRYFDGAHLTARELGSIGNFILNNGTWNNEILIDNLFQRLSEPSGITPGFGLTVWLNSDIDQNFRTSFYDHIPESIFYLWGETKLIHDQSPSDVIMVAGRYNQRLTIIPSDKIVIVRFGRENFTWSDNEFLSRLLCKKS